MTTRTAVAAREMGSDVQSMFFWYQAANLLIDRSRVQRVVLEHDGISGMDDVVVFYRSPGVDTGGRLSTADFYQVKYHVDQRDAYCSKTLIESGFAGCKSSLLQRFCDGYKTARTKHGWFLLNFASNWGWKSEDLLATSIREDGSLPSAFFSCSARGRLGVIRESWREHLEIPFDDFIDFAGRLRFHPNYLNRRQFQEALNDRLGQAGLTAVPVDRRANPYTDLARKFIMDGPTDFDAKIFTEICKQEGLLVNGGNPAAKSPSIGIRSFLRFAERIESETDSHVCVAKHFDGRHILDQGLWTSAVLPAVESFLKNPTLREQAHNLLLECHGSIAFAAGFALNRKSGTQVFPVQKGTIRAPWMPSPYPAWPDGEPEWKIETVDKNDSAENTAIAISATNHVLSDVEQYLSDAAIPVRQIVHILPSSGPSYLSVKGADHAVMIADKIVQEARQQRKNGITGKIHLFAAAPNALLYFLGQSGRAMGQVQLYEFDFENERGGTYTPSFSLP